MGNTNIHVPMSSCQRYEHAWSCTVPFPVDRACRSLSRIAAFARFKCMVIVSSSFLYSFRRSGELTTCQLKADTIVSNYMPLNRVRLLHVEADTCTICGFNVGACTARLPNDGVLVPEDIASRIGETGSK